ncbi:hypothetical protein EB796_019767 [Bugula neritina]|uniref:Male-enhanced antigen 1 n=1 Tax=Bugula neritina TaxID=10212 RepID=A0A7J7J6R0_BUGNE|nr:hypothetical protein EB796_019767 [Bugula neritina]
MTPAPDPKGSPAGDVEPELHNIGGPQVIEVSSDSDSDFDMDVDGGYVPLAQGSDSNSSSSDEDDAEFPPELPAPGNITMPEKQANEIKAAMANIKLPNIPPWAKQIPEQQWMSSLMENLTRTRGQGQCNVKGQDQTNHASTSSQRTIAHLVKLSRV